MLSDEEGQQAAGMAEQEEGEAVARRREGGNEAELQLVEQEEQGESVAREREGSNEAELQLGFRV